MGVLNRRSSKEGIFTVRGGVMGVHRPGGSKSHCSQVIQVPISNIISLRSIHQPRADEYRYSVSGFQSVCPSSFPFDHCVRWPCSLSKKEKVASTFQRRRGGVWTKLLVDGIHFHSNQPLTAKRW